MKLSFVYMTVRAGGIDLLTSSLHEQRTDKEWELIVVDGFPGRVQRGHAENYMTQRGIPLRAYVPPKPKTFPWSRTGFANAINTGALYATGDYVVYLHDYTLYPPDMVETWHAVLSATDGRTLVHGSSREYETTPPDALGDVTTWKNGELPPMTYRGDWVPELFELGYFALPMSFLEEGNGVDERADFCFVFPTKSVVAKARLLDYKMRVDVGIMCGMIDHHLWEKRPDRLSFHKNSHWRIPGEYSDVPEEPVWTAWGANPYNFAAERVRVAYEMSKPVRPHPQYFFLPGKGVVS